MINPAQKSTSTMGGVSSLLRSFVAVQSSVLRTNFCVKKPAYTLGMGKVATNALGNVQQVNEAIPRPKRHRTTLTFFIFGVPFNQSSPFHS